MLAVALGETLRGVAKMRAGIAALEFRDELGHKLRERDASERHRAQPLQETAVHVLQSLGDRQNLGDAVLHLLRLLAAHLLALLADRGGIDRDAEQAGTDLVVKLVGDEAALLLLHRDQIAIEAVILLAGGAECGGELVEAARDRADLAHLRRREAKLEVAVLEPAHAARQRDEGIENVSQHGVEHRHHQRVGAEPQGRERAQIVPHLGDLVGRLAGNEDRRHALAVRVDVDAARLELRRDEAGEPFGHHRYGIQLPVLAAGVGGHRVRVARGIENHDLEVAQMAELRGEHARQPLDVLLRGQVAGGLLDEARRKLYGRAHLDLGAIARVEHDNHAGNDRRQHGDEEKGEQDLPADGTVVPDTLDSARCDRPDHLAARCHPAGEGDHRIQPCCLAERRRERARRSPAPGASADVTLFHIFRHQESVRVRQRVNA
jgi:hypothetical protein